MTIMAIILVKGAKSLILELQQRNTSATRVRRILTVTADVTGNKTLVQFALENTLRKQARGQLAHFAAYIQGYGRTWFLGFGRKKY